MNKTRTSVVLADDHAMFREAVRSLLAVQPDLEVVAEAGTGPEAVDQVREKEPRLLCLDLSMPGWGGAVTIEKVRAASPRTQVLVLTMHDDPEYVRTAVTAGAAGYVFKTASSADLLVAVRAVSAGQRVFPPTAGGEERAPATSGTAQLSRRERDVLELLTRGLTHQEIADRLFLSVKTVETYRLRIRTKTGLQTRADFVRYGVEAGLLTTNPKTIPPPDPAC